MDDIPDYHDPPPPPVPLSSGDARGALAPVVPAPRPNESRAAPSTADAPARPKDHDRAADHHDVDVTIDGLFGADGHSGDRRDNADAAGPERGHGVPGATTGQPAPSATSAPALTRGVLAPVVPASPESSDHVFGLVAFSLLLVKPTAPLVQDVAKLNRATTTTPMATTVIWTTQAALPPATLRPPPAPPSPRLGP